MAGALPGLFDPDPHAVLVAVDAQFGDALGVAGRFAFAPQLLPRTAEVPRLAGFDGAGKRLTVHVRDHQHVAGCRIGRHAGDEAVGVESRRKLAALLNLLGRAARRKGRWIGHRWPPWPRAHARESDGSRAARTGRRWSPRQPRPRETSEAFQRPSPRTSVMNRTCSAASSRNAPRKCDVMVSAPGFCTPRMDMQVCSASMSTATPRGLRISSMAVAT